MARQEKIVEHQERRLEMLKKLFPNEYLSLIKEREDRQKAQESLRQSRLLELRAQREILLTKVQ